MDHGQFLGQMAMLAMTLPPRQPLEDAALEGYWLGLQGITNEQLAAGVARALRECEFMPAPVELRRLSRQRDLVASTDAKILQLRAWQRGGQ